MFSSLQNSASPAQNVTLMRKLARAAKKRQHDLNTSIPHRRKEYSTADVHFIDSLFLSAYPVKADIPNAHFEVRLVGEFGLLDFMVTLDSKQINCG